MRKLFTGAIALTIAGLLGAGIFVACKKEGTSQNTLQSTSAQLAERKKKVWEIRRSSATGWYHWSVACIDKNGDTTFTDGGSFAGNDAKKLCRQAIRRVDCSLPPIKNIYVSIMSPFLDDPQGSLNALIVNGNIAYIDVVNPWTNEFQRFTQDNISANLLAWLSEICPYVEADLLQVDKVMAQLKVWGVYLGGNCAAEILPLHNLTAEQFTAIAEKSWETIIIEQVIIEGDEDDTIRLLWTFEY